MCWTYVSQDTNPLWAEGNMVECCRLLKASEISRVAERLLACTCIEGFCTKGKDSTFEVTYLVQ
jgi:hypothetical protein